MTDEELSDSISDILDEELYADDDSYGACPWVEGKHEARLRIMNFIKENYIAKD